MSATVKVSLRCDDMSREGRCSAASCLDAPVTSSGLIDIVNVPRGWTLVRGEGSALAELWVFCPKHRGSAR